MLCSISSLQNQDLEAIRDLENRISKTLLAFSCHEMKFADLSPDELAGIQELENRLGINLVAVDTA